MITSLFRVCTGALMLPLLLTGALASNLSDPELTFKNLEKEYQSIEPGASRCQRLFVLRPLSSKLDAFIESYPTSETAARLISGQTVGGFNLESLENEVDGLTSAIDQEARELVELTHDTIIELVQLTDWEPSFERLASVEKTQEMLHQRYSCRSADIRLDAIQIASLRAKFVALREIDAQLAIKEMVIGNIVSARAAGSPCARVELLIKAQESFNHITVRFDGADAVQEFADGERDSTSSLMALRKETNWQEKACLQHVERQNKDANAALVSIVSSFKKAKTETRREEKLDLYADVLEALDELLAAYPGSTIALEHGRIGCFGTICRQEIAKAIEDLIEKRQTEINRELAAVKKLWKDADKEQKVGEKVALYSALIDRLEILVKQFSGSTEASALLSGDVVGGVSLREAKTRLKSVIDKRNRDASTRHKEIERLLGSVENSKNPNTRLEATLAAMEALQQLVVLYTDAEINARPELKQLDGKINSQIEQEQYALNAVARSLFEKAAISFRKGTSTDETSTSRRQTLQKSFDILEDIKTQFPLSAIGGAIINTGGFEGLALSAVQQEIDQLEAETIKRQAFVSEIIDLTQCSLDKETTYPNRITCLRAALTTVGEIEKNFPGVPVQNLCADEGKSCLRVSKTEVTSRIAQLISVCERDANTIVRNAKSVFPALEKEGLTRTRGLKQLQGSRADLDRISQDFACGSVTSESFTSAVQVARDRLTTRINKEEQLLAAARKQFVHTQSVCAKANLDVRRKSPQIAITALDECLKVSNNFSQQYPKTKFSQVISKGGAFVPLVRIGEYRCQALSGNKCFLQGSINRIDAALVINPEEKKVVLSANQAKSFNLAKGIKMRSNESGVSRTLYLTHIDVIRFGSIEIKDVEAFIDPLASNERVVLGDEVLKQFDITTTDDAMTLHQERIDGKTVIAGLGMQSLKDMRYRLIQKEGKQVLTGLKEVQSLLKQAKVIQSVKRFDERLILISKAESLLEQIAKAHKIIPDNIKDRMDSDRATFRDFKSVTVNAREDAAVALCGAVKNQIENARRLSDSIEILKQIEVARAHLDELDYHFSNTRKGTDLRTDPSICGLSEDQLANEVKAAGKIKQVIACKTDGLKATFFGTRMKYYDCAVRGLEAIEQKYADTIIGVRVKDGIVLNDVSKNIVQDLINNERLAQESFKKVGPMIEEEVFELGYLRRYTFMSEALELIDKIMDLDSTVDLKQLRALQKQAHETRLDAESKMAIEPVMITLNGQCYQMGSLKSDFDAATDEKRHQVCLEDFAIAKYEVTFHEYDQFVRATGADKPKDRGWGREDRPVIYVSLDDIEQYIEWINGETGKSYRLPTEAEWEFAARGGQQSRYSWGDEVKEDAANCMNCGTEWSGRRTAPVGSFNANPYGLYDMAGNVSENTCSIYRKQYDDSERVCALGDASGNRVLRGGSWKSHSRQLRPANRRELSDPTQRSPYQGFRLATDG